MLRYSLHKLAPAASTATITPRCPRRFLWSPQFRARSLAVTRQAVMGDKIQLYSIATPNGQKLGIALEELGLEYDAHRVDISKGDQFKPEFIVVNPNSKIPAITDPNGPDGKPINVFESGAILLYLAEKTGKLLPADPRLKWETIQWLFFQMAGVGPMFGQFFHFAKYAKDKCDHPYPAERYKTESKRLLGVLENHLQARKYLVGDEYTVADIANFTWVNTALKNVELGDIQTFPNLAAWLERINAREATQRGLKVCAF